MYFSLNSAEKPVRRGSARIRFPTETESREKPSKESQRRLTDIRGFQKTCGSKRSVALHSRPWKQEHYTSRARIKSEVTSSTRRVVIVNKTKKTRNSKLSSFHADGNCSQAEMSIPGLAVLFSGSGWIRKIFWGLAVAFCVSFCFVQIRRQVLNFWKVPITVDVKIIRDENPLFPVVTVCPFYPFRYNKQLQHRIRKSASYQLNASRMTTLRAPFFSLLQDKHENVTNLWRYGRVREDDVKTLLLCKIFSTSMNCHLKVVRKEIITYLGFCSSYTLSERIKYDGPYNGFHLYYHVHQNTGGTDYTILFHHPNDDPTHFLYKYSGSLVTNFVRTCFLYTRQEFSNVNIPRLPCLPRAEVSECYRKCVERTISENTTCRLPYMTTSLLELCSTPESADHTYNVTLQVYQQLEGYCRQCPRKCDDDVYRLTETPLTKHNFTMLTVHMVDNVVQVVTELTPYTFDKLLSDIGGMMGLFMGMCILTMLQVLESLAIQIKQKLLLLWRHP